LLIRVACSSASSGKNFSSGVTRSPSLGAIRARKNGETRFKLGSSGVTSWFPSFVTNTIACFKSGDMRTSEIVKCAVAKAGS